MVAILLVLLDRVEVPVEVLVPVPVPVVAVPSHWFGLVNLLRCGWAFCPSHFPPTVKWGPPRNAKLNKC